MSKVFTTLLLFVSIFAVASTKEQIRTLDASEDIKKINESLLYPIDSGAAGVQQIVTFTVSMGAEELFTEIYVYDGTGEKGLTVLPINLGGAADGRQQGVFLQGDLQDFNVTVTVNGKTAETMSATQFLEQDLVLRNEDISILDVVAIERGEKSDEDIAADEEAAAKASFQCPNTFPYCDIAHDDCEERCDYGDPHCLETCSRLEAECYGGRVVAGWTETETLSQIYDFQDCWWYPWYNISPKLWNVYNMTFRKTQFQRRYCESVGQTYTIQVRTWIEHDRCYLNTGIPCSLDGSSYLSNACKL